MNIEMKPGTLIKVKPEFLNPGERNVPYMVVEDRGDRILYQELREYAKQPILGRWCESKEYFDIIDADIADQASQAFNSDLF